MNNLIKTSRYIAALSFIVGTILFALQLYFKDAIRFTSLGAGFIIIAFILNSILLIGLLFRLLFGIILKAINLNETVKLITTAGLVLLNVPITVIYLICLIEFL